jgi:hypothetical protein
VAQATRSTDPRLRAPQFQQHWENWTSRALDNMRLKSETKAAHQPIAICNDYKTDTSSDWLRYARPCPPTPPRPSQKRLGEEEGVELHLGNGGKTNIPPTTTNNVGWDKDKFDEDAEDAISSHKIQNEEATAREGSQVDDGELEEGMADDRIRGDHSPQSTRRYTQEELDILTRQIFGDEGEEVDPAFWDDADGAPWPAIDHPAKHEGAGMIDQQVKECDTGGLEGEGACKADEASKSDGLFGPTSNISPSTSPQDGLPHSHQDEDDDQNAEVVQDVLEAAAGSATVDTSDSVNSSEYNTPPTTTTSMFLATPESPCTALRSSSPTQCPPSPENGFEIRSAKDDAPTGKLQPGKALEADAGANEGHSDPMPLPTTQVDPSGELEPCKLAVVAPSKEEPHSCTIRYIIRKKGLPEFSPTRPGIFSTLIVNSADHSSIGKRKRSREDVGDEEERAFSPASIPQGDRRILRPR